MALQQSSKGFLTDLLETLANWKLATTCVYELTETKDIMHHTQTVLAMFSTNIFSKLHWYSI